MDPIAVLGIGLSVAAFSLSLMAFVDGRRKDKRDLFIDMHRTLITAEMQQARRTIYELAESGWSGATRDQEDAATRALASFDLLGLYVDRGHVSKDETIDTWGLTLVKTVAAAAPYLEHRRERQPYLWEHLSRLATDADAYFAARPPRVVAPPAS